jgi:hypothetical protein
MNRIADRGQCGPHGVQPHPDDDPDETDGRKLYRNRADTLSSAQLHIAKRSVSLTKLPLSQTEENSGQLG